MSENISVYEKKCNKCKVIKLTTEFYRNAHSKNGINSICKTCQLLATNEWMKKTCYTKSGKAMFYRKLKYGNDYWKYGRGNRMEQSRRYCKKHPDIIQAARQLDYAIRHKLIYKPSTCSKCGNGGHINGYHNNTYHDVLKVIWLCNPCMVKEYRKNLILK